jgi:hypothetical protein
MDLIARMIGLLKRVPYGEVASAPLPWLISPRKMPREE